MSSKPNRPSGGGIPTAHPSGGGGGGNKGPMDQYPGSPDTLEQALGEKGRPMSTERAVMRANPFYDGSYGEYSENCQRAVIATEARMRGYDVIAQPTYDGDTMPSRTEWMKAFKGAKEDYVGKSTASATQRAVENQMKQYGDGSRAVLGLAWKGGGGHVINVFQKNGKTYYYDGQIGAKYDPKELFSAIKTKNTDLIRVDNLDFGSRAREAVRQRPKGL